MATPSHLATWDQRRTIDNGFQAFKNSFWASSSNNYDWVVGRERFSTLPQKWIESKRLGADMEPTVKGFFLNGVIDEVKKQKGKEGVKRLEELMGETARFSPFKDYIMKDTIKLYDSVAELLFGDNNDDTQLEVGKLTVSVYTDSIVGKTMLSLLGRNIKKTALSIPRIFDTIGSGFEFETEDLGPQKVRIRIKNDLFNIHFRKGMFLAGVEALGGQPTIGERTLALGDYEFLIEWNQSKE